MKVMVMAGGTGGHIYPALAVARELLDTGHQVCWLGSTGGMESRIVPEHGFAIDFIAVKGLRGNGLKGWVLAPFKLLAAVWQARAHMKKQQPHSVLGMGGFVTGPGGVAAKLLGIPLVIHEQNAVAGLTNRLLSHLAVQVLQAFPHTLAHATTVGNPVRAEIAALAAKEKVGLPLHILVIGGSLGAQALNEVLPEALAGCALDIHVRHQTGRNKLAATAKAYQQQQVPTEKYSLLEFIDAMDEALHWADVVICRAGAMTVFELAAAGKPALFVPFPQAVDDHQSANAAYLVDQGAAQLLPQSMLSAAVLQEKIRGWVENLPALVARGEKAKAAHVADAGEKVAKICLEVAA